MSRLNPYDNRVIRITHDEANSQHVDDMLKRQASLRGESGITRDRKGRWYYSNWFIFMVAGLLAAFGAWALLEPHYDDMLYIQGPLEQVHLDANEPLTFIDLRTQEEFVAPAKGWVQVNGQKAWVLGVTTFRDEDGTRSLLVMDNLRLGRETGLYMADDMFTKNGEPLAMYIVPNPSSDPPAKARTTVEAQLARNKAIGMILFAVVAAMVSMAIGMADGIVCRAPRRILLAGAVGLVVGFLGGFVSHIIANLVYMPLTTMATAQHGDAAGGMTTLGFLMQTGGRGLAWCLVGMAMGLAQGIALRSTRLLIYGFLGGVIGGLLGGLLFDPVQFLIVGADSPSAHWSRLIGLLVIGGAVGAMIGVVELLARDAWLRMVQGPLAGKEFVIFKDIMHLGSSPRSEIYLFNDPQVEPQHATIRSVGDNYEIECDARTHGLLVNGRPMQRGRLHHGDQIEIGRTVFSFQKRKD